MKSALLYMLVRRFWDARDENIADNARVLEGYIALTNGLKIFLVDK